MSNNYEGWKHINSAPKDKEVLVWDGQYRYVAKWCLCEWVCFNTYPVHPTHWRGCPPPPDFTLEDDQE